MFVDGGRPDWFPPGCIATGGLPAGWPPPGAGAGGASLFAAGAGAAGGRPGMFVDGGRPDWFPPGCIATGGLSPGRPPPGAGAGGACLFAAGAGAAGGRPGMFVDGGRPGWFPPGCVATGGLPAGRPPAAAGAGADLRRVFRASGLRGTPLDLSSSGRCCSKLTGRGGGAVLEATCRGATSRAGAVAGVCPPRTAALVGTTLALAIKLTLPTAPAGTVTAIFPTGRPEANPSLGTTISAPLTLTFSYWMLVIAAFRTLTLVVA